MRKIPGLRECFTAREDTYYADADFSGLELCTVAQVCLDVLGHSKLAEAINGGLDPHLDVAADYLGIPYQEALENKNDPKIKQARDAAKPPNFGFPGGLGPNGLIAFAWAGYRQRFTVEQAKESKALWFRKWPEFHDYFAWIRSHVDEKDEYTMTQVRSGRVRGRCRYTEASNTMFQGLGADGAKNAVWEVARASYDETRQSKLFGFRPIFFVHDQIIGETPIEKSHVQAIELGRVMVDACNKFLPDVPVKCEPCLSKHWTKNATAVYNAPPLDGGTLLPWDLSRDAKTKCYYSDGKQVKW